MSATESRFAPKFCTYPFGDAGADIGWHLDCLYHTLCDYTEHCGKKAAARSAVPLARLYEREGVRLARFAAALVVYRGEGIPRGFDDDMRAVPAAAMARRGIVIERRRRLEAIDREARARRSQHPR